MNTFEKELVKKDNLDNNEGSTAETSSDPGQSAMEVTFGRGRNKKTLLCSQGYTLKNIVEISK